MRLSCSWSRSRWFSMRSRSRSPCQIIYLISRARHIRFQRSCRTYQSQVNLIIITQKRLTHLPNAKYPPKSNHNNSKVTSNNAVVHFVCCRSYRRNFLERIFDGFFKIHFEVLEEKLLRRLKILEKRKSKLTRLLYSGAICYIAARRQSWFRVCGK